VGANSQAFANTGTLVTCVNNFPETRDVGLDILKGFVGLSGVMYAQLYQALYGGEDAESLILLVAWLPAAVSVAFVHTVCYMSYPRRRVGDELRPFFCFLYMSIALACFSRAAYGVAAVPRTGSPPRRCSSSFMTTYVVQGQVPFCSSCCFLLDFDLSSI
jgi:hypothetical protein